MKFKSKVDAWLAILLWGAVLSCFFPLFLTFDWVMLFTGLAMAGLVGALWVGTYYLVEGDTLVISGGIVKRRIPIAQITTLRKTRNPLSSPALSMNRIEVSYGIGHMVLISPKEQQAFIDMLLAQNPTIQVDPKLQQKETA